MTNFSKIEARLQLQGMTNTLSDEDFAAKSALILGTVEKLISDTLASGTAGKILLYMPMQKYHEVDLSPLRASFPQLSFDDAPQNPSGEFPVVSYDIIFAPLYGFNFDRYRLGHGSGWYDRFLALQPQALKVGIGLDIGRVDFTPEPHDVPMDHIVTESTRDLF